MRKVKFSDCVEYMIKGPFGSDMKKSLYVPKGDNTYKVYIQINAIQKDQTLGDYYVSEEYYHKKLERFEVHPGDYLITCDGTLGKFIKLDENSEKGVISSSLLLLKLKEDVIYDKYFELIWEFSMLGYLASQARNACLVHLPSAKAIGDVEITLPELEEQIELADRAFTVSNIVEKRKHELTLFDNLIKARFVEMFGDPETSEKYPHVAVKEITEVISGGTPDRKNNTYWENGTVPWVKTTELQNNRLSDIGEYITEKGLNESSAKIVPEGTVLIAMYGQGKTRGMTAILDVPASTNQACACLLPSEKIESEYLWQYMIMSYDRLRNLAQGGNQPNLNGNMIKNFTVLIPSKDKQIEFVEFVKQVDKSKVAVQRALDETQLLFDSLMQEYFG